MERLNSTRITFTLLADHLNYVHIFLQIPVGQLKLFSRRRGAGCLTVCPWFQEKSVNLCCCIRIWLAKVCVGVNVKGNLPPGNSAVCSALPIQVQFTYNWCTVPWMGSVRLTRTSFVVDLDQWCRWIGRFHSAVCLYTIITWGVICAWGILRIISIVLSAPCELKDFSKVKMIPKRRSEKY